MEKIPFEEVIVMSPIKDEKMNSHIRESEIWKKAYHPEEVTEEVLAKYPAWYEYRIDFQGLIPVHLKKFTEK
jgi:hypothetical protein